MPAIDTAASRGGDPTRVYPVSLQQSAAAIFGIAVVDAPPGTSFSGDRSHSGHRQK